MPFLRISLFLALVSTSFFAKGQNTRADTIRMLCQTWKMKESDKEPIDPDLKEEWDDMMKNSRTTFKPDMTFIESYPDEVQKGKWSLDKSGKQITTIQDGDTQQWIIVALSSSMLKVKQEIPEINDSVTVTFIPFKKQ